MEFLTAAAVSAAAVVTFVTQALKYIPVEWTSKYAVYVNIVLSFIGALIVGGVPVLNANLWEFVVQWLVIAVVAAIAFHSLVKPALEEPKV